MELCDLKFWEDYWANIKLPIEIDLRFCIHRCIINTIKKYIHPQEGGEVFEVGCAPGKWLAFMAKEFSMRPSGIEHVEEGMRATVKNLGMLDIIPDHITHGDFLKFNIDRQFDIVMSFGFIEHFENVEHVVDLHMKLLKPGGILILGVPNFLGVYYFLQKILDNEILNKHNLIK